MHACQLSISCSALPETAPLPPELCTSPLLSPNAITGKSTSSRPSEQYEALVGTGAIKADPHQRAVLESFDQLHTSLPQYQHQMVAHASKVKQWLLDWETARDELIRIKLAAIEQRRTSVAQTKLATPFAYAVKSASESANERLDQLPQAVVKGLALPELIQWASTRTDEQEGRLVVYEEEIDAMVGRPFPETPQRPAGVYLHGSVGTGKSLCMDIFFASTQGHTEQRRRVHFNAFMLEVQARLHKYGQSAAGKTSGRAHLAMRGSSTGHTLTKAAAAVREKWEAEEEEARQQANLERAPMLVDGVTVVGRDNCSRPLPLVQGREVHDPFSAIAREILGPVAEHGGLLCFDELQVNDPFNAVAVREIFLRLIELGVIVVSTSNRELESLNRWRSNTGDATFRPLVDALSAECQQLSLDGADYRRAEQPRANAATMGYIVGGSTGSLDAIFAKLREEISTSCDVCEEHFTNESIPVMFGRSLDVPQGCWRGPGGSKRGVARFSFDQLCGANLGSSDYAALAAQFSVVMIDTIPTMDFETRAYARRFITLVDELYNRRVQLICTADKGIDDLFTDVAQYDASHDLENMAFETEMEGNKSRFDLTKEASVAAGNRSLDNYTGEDEQFAFSRAASRLHEMQTDRYWHQLHLFNNDVNSVNL